MDCRRREDGEQRHRPGQNRQFWVLHRPRVTEAAGLVPPNRSRQHAATALIGWRGRLAATGLFDHFLRILSDEVDPYAEETRQQRFEFGLDCVLLGSRPR
jgi:hypothetical protein